MGDLGKQLIQNLSDEQRSAARALHLGGRSLELFLEVNARLEEKEKHCDPHTLFPIPNPECVTPTTFGLLVEGEVSDTKLESLYGPHIRKCESCTRLYQQYGNLKADYKK